jgi:WD40 repeat protein
VDLLAEHSPTKFKPEVIAALKSGAISLPNPISLPKNEAVSLDNKTVARADSLGIQIIDTRTGKRKFMLTINSDVTALAFSHRGDLLAVGYADHTFATYKMDTGAKSFEVHLPSSATVSNILFDENDQGLLIITAAGNRRFLLGPNVETETSTQ